MKKLTVWNIRLLSGSEKLRMFLLQTERIEREELRKMFSAEKSENFPQQRNEKI